MSDVRAVSSTPGTDRGRGCMVFVRPDQFVAHVLSLGAHVELSAFFGRFITPGEFKARLRSGVEPAA